MAKIYEEIVVIKLSKLVKTDKDVKPGSLVSKDLVSALEQVSQELVGENIVVEVEVA